MQYTANIILKNRQLGYAIVQNAIKMDSFVLSVCMKEHMKVTHHLDMLSQRLLSLNLLIHSRTQQDLTKEGQLSYARMQNYLEETSQSIYKQAQKLNKLSQFMENLNETLLSLQEIGEEVDIAYTILYNMDKKETGEQMYPPLMITQINFRLLMDINLDSQNHEVSIKPSSISPIENQEYFRQESRFHIIIKKNSRRT
ncbi:unnamed protein product (macronuclear) [Paramecium tetraurelia]|uniref:Uncharacterized protein n=1 Tax=Paramecium tetraurelia TaxID=5888 RepID=A0BQ50_PARTE|nr:uncharacterized protein GSPATT00005418001 [Paramecium tetraurelia]CAK60667.1 unnamed protein product [Paramecium tetraurelia]|eukprot:XP_001428065.1 hypothetical protein (macronuclear) [Paramecium tetraurelia strain d4-2]